MQVENIGYAVRNDRKRVSCRIIGVGQSHVVEADRRIVERRGADINACATPRQIRWRAPRIFEGLENEFEQKTLLRINLFGFPWGNPEHCGIEPPDIVERSRCPSIAAATFLGPWMSEASLRPSIFWNFRYGASARAHEFPKGIYVWSPWQTTRSTDNRYVLGAGRQNVSQEGATQ